ncbi:hypothetical protein, partial [Phascolarctobacterium succinatutens]|uniref:hypothetical protein n=1 Tax=Phascolarctobacterium succinatutens TaxID=626940 RepID=UPI003077B83A
RWCERSTAQIMSTLLLDFLRYNDAEKHSFCCFGSGNNPSVCSPVLAATSPYRGDIFVPQSMEGYTKEIIFGHDLGNGLPAKIYP